MIGALVVFVVGVLFRTPEPVLAAAARHARRAETAADVPLALREPLESAASPMPAASAESRPGSVPQAPATPSVAPRASASPSSPGRR
jgi:hypothetical protein